MTTRYVDLRAEARALLADERGTPIVLRPEALQRVVEVARSSSPVVGSLEPQAARPGELEVRGGVAIVPLQGVITPRGSFLSLLFGGGVGGLQGFRRDLNAALGSADVDAIVLDVHSPGGLIGLVPEVASELRAARGTKPITAVANTMTASAAYWIAAQADELVVTPSGFVGSIGVYVLHEDWSGFNEQMGIAPTYVYAGRFKVEGNPDEPLSDEARAALQAEVDDLYSLFVDDVAAARGATPQAVRDGYGEGRVLPASRAVAEGLADRVGTIDDVVRELSRGARAGGRGRKASDPAPTIRATAGDNPGPNAEQAEEVRARIADLAKAEPPPTIR